VPVRPRSVPAPGRNSDPSQPLGHHGALAPPLALAMIHSG
jgi:hypothetical protein